MILATKTSERKEKRSERPIKLGIFIAVSVHNKALITF